MKHLSRTLVLLPLALAVACNTNYNFDNISLEVTVGDTDGISIPVGSTDKITVSSLLGDSLEPGEDGSYGFSFSDHMSHTVELGTIDPIVGLAPAIDPITSTLIGDINTSEATFSGTKSLAFPEGVHFLAFCDLLAECVCKFNYLSHIINSFQFHRTGRMRPCGLFLRL